MKPNNYTRGKEIIDDWLYKGSPLPRLIDEYGYGEKNE